MSLQYELVTNVVHSMKTTLSESRVKRAQHQQEPGYMVVLPGGIFCASIMAASLLGALH